MVTIQPAGLGGTPSTGQRCTASSRVIVTEGIHDKFVAALSERLAKITVPTLVLVVVFTQVAG